MNDSIQGLIKVAQSHRPVDSAGPPFQSDHCIRYFFNAQPHAQKDHDDNENFVIYTVHWARGIARIFRWGRGILWALRGRERPSRVGGPGVSFLMKIIEYTRKWSKSKAFSKNISQN